MTALAVNDALLSVESYLASEERSDVKHEYLAGVPHTMAGSSIEQNIIAANLLIRVGGRLWGKPCAIVGSDLKLKVQIPTATYFYYPDATIVCGAPVRGQSWCENPCVIFEIVSESTRLTDEREKSANYKAIPSLDAYVRIEQATRRVVVERRTADTWMREVLDGAEALLRLPTVDVEFPIGELYERLDLP